MLAPTQSQLVDAGSADISTIHAAPPDLGGRLTWRLINDADGTISIAESSDGIVEIDDGHDPVLRRYDRPYTAPLSAGRFLAVWRYFTESVAQSVVVAAGDAAFATDDDVAARLGRALTAQESGTTVPYLLETAAAVIADAAGYDEGWALSLSPVPALLSRLSVEMVCRSLDNPAGYDSIRQQAGSYSFQVAQSNGGMTLSQAETLMVRRAVHGRTTDTAQVDSGFIAAQDEYWLRKQAIRAEGLTSSGGTIA